MLATRIATALVLIAAVLAALFLLPPEGWGALSLCIMALAATEWATLAGLPKPAWWLFVVGTLVIGVNLLLSPVSGFDQGWPSGVIVAVCGVATLFWFLVAPLWLARHWKPERHLAMAITGWVVLIGAWVAVVELQARSPWLVLAAMAIVWIADTAAYFTGRAIGRRRLAPEISPGKTWEGVYGALAAVALYALLLTPKAGAAGYSGAPTWTSIALWIVIAIVLAAVSIVGDLFESLLKRQAGVKDSGHLLPGHGGVLDRIDALLAAMPAVALLAAFFLR
jgi:phosphatidate cytidylyltransferase